MPPLSGKQRKAQLQIKRAVKRGDAPPPPQTQAKKNKRPPQNTRQTPEARHAADQVAQAARKLQSEFVKLDKNFLDETRSLAGSIVLHRPVSGDIAILRNEWITPTPTRSQLPATQLLAQLTVPKRPKWRYQMSKEELDANEQAYFRKWLTQQDAIVEEWQRSLNAPLPSDISQTTPQAGEDSETRQMPYPPTHFERNIQVWRQFWRVTEISQILLVLLDSRCPPLHLPPSLATYLDLPTSSPDEPRPRSRNSAKSKAPRVILVLTKIDISGPARTASWTTFLNAKYPGVPVVPVEAYAAKPTPSADQGRTRYEPHLPGTFRERLVHTIRDIHQQMLLPPEWVTAPRPGESEEERQQRIRRWRPRVKTTINWEGVIKAKGKMVGKAVGGAAVPKGEPDAEGQPDGQANEEDNAMSSDGEEEKSGEGDGNTHQWKEPEFLTIGLIGQPNVGKSSLLNAIFGATRVRASRTPGKTKHFQTLFWTSDVRLVDCPGLVMPSFVPMDIQVLSGVLPISRISAVPFCVHQLARLLPLEQIFELTHPIFSTTPAFAMSTSNMAGVIASTRDPDSMPRSSKAGSKSKSASKSANAVAILSEDKRTWRPGQRPVGQSNVRSKVPKWTANDLVTAYADEKGWVTAKAGRPDVHRAGNAMLRFVAEGRIPWAFWPPGCLVSGDDGIWLKDGAQQHAWDELDIDDEDGSEEEGDESEEDESEIEEMSSEEVVNRVGVKVALSHNSNEDEDEEDEKAVPTRGNIGRFGALVIDDD